MQASNGPRKRIPENALETTNNLVVQATKFPPPVGDEGRLKPMILWFSSASQKL
jgi:hypothetical protein